MNYLAELRAFDDWLDLNELNSSAISLWFALMRIANKCGWKESFNVPIATLEHKSGLNRSAVYRARNVLKQAGLITFKDRGANRPSEYSMGSVFQCDTQCGTQSDTQCGTQSETQCGTQSDTIHKQNKTKQNKSNTPIPPRFDEFWKIYPNRKAKQDAEKAWKKLDPDNTLVDRILDDIRIRIGSRDWQRDNGRYIPHPATYLNGHRWEDEESVSVDAWTAIGMKMGAL